MPLAPPAVCAPPMPPGPQVRSTHVEAPEDWSDAPISAAFLGGLQVHSPFPPPGKPGSLRGWAGPFRSDGPMDPREFAFTNPALSVNPAAFSNPAASVPPHLQMQRPLQMPTFHVVRDPSQVVQTGVPGISAPSGAPKPADSPHEGRQSADAAEARHPRKGRGPRRSGARSHRPAHSKAAARRKPKRAAAAPSMEAASPQRARPPLPDATATPRTPRALPQHGCTPAAESYEHAPLHDGGSTPWPADMCGAAAAGGGFWSDDSLGLSLSLPSEFNVSDGPPASCDDCVDKQAAAHSLNELLGSDICN